MALPNTYTDQNETGCCAVPNYQAWDKQTFEFEGLHFIRKYTWSFLYMPLNMGSVMKTLNETATSTNVLLPPNQAMILSHDLSPWKAEQLYGVSAPVQGSDNVTLSGTFWSRAFEGPYKDVRIWQKAIRDDVEAQEHIIKNLYFFYTTCPKCAEYYGKNYVIVLAEIA